MYRNRETGMGNRHWNSELKVVCRLLPYIRMVIIAANLNSRAERGHLNEVVDDWGHRTRGWQ